MNKKTPIPSWAKLIAKVIDSSIVFLLLVASVEFLPFYLPDLAYLVMAIAAPAILVPLDRFLMRKMGSTPGRALVGIRKGRAFAPPWLHKCAGILAAAIGLFGSLCGTPWNPITVNLSTPYKGKTGWTPYKSEEKGFRIQLPSQPTHETSNVDIPHVSEALEYNEVKSEGKRDVVYAVGYLDLPRKWKFFGSQNILKGAVQLLQKSSPDVKIISHTLTRHYTHPAIDFHYRQGDEEVKGRLVLIGCTLYKLSVTYPNAVADNDLKSKEFIQSFLPQKE